MDISVIICTWNRAPVLDRTLETLRRQKWEGGARVEVLVVDNNSTDATFDVVRKRQDAWPLGELRYLREQRQGKQFALNFGVRSASGKILAFTDDDVLVPEDWIASILHVFSDQAVEMAGGRTLLLWPESGPPRWFRTTMSAVVAGVDLGVEPLQSVPEDYAPAGTNAIIRRSVFDRIGLYSEAHFRHMDYEFGQRALSSGVAVVYDPRLVVKTEVPLEIVNKRYFRRWYFKLGIAEAMQAQNSYPMLFGVPRWIWRQLLQDILTVGLGLICGQSDKVFEREVFIAKFFGYIASVWHKKLRPSMHQQWVERWSQKKGVNFG